MKIYFVRHGQSVLNAKRVHQSRTVELSGLGEKQAGIVAKRLLTLPIDILVSSEFKRAEQTALIIGKIIGKDVIYAKYFNERKRPTAIEGKETDHPDALEIKKQIIENFDNPNYKHSDEETFFEIKARAKIALDYLIDLNKDHVAVVTHGDFIRMMIGVMCWGDNFKPQDYLLFSSFLVLENTAITVCEHVNDKWRLLNWNDQAHLEG